LEEQYLKMMPWNSRRLFLLFHSSISGLKWVAENWGWDIFKKMYEKTGWLASTMFEGWGFLT